MVRWELIHMEDDPRGIGLIPLTPSNPQSILFQHGLIPFVCLDHGWIGIDNTNLKFLNFKSGQEIH